MSQDPGLSDNITLFVAVLLSEQKDQVLVVAPPAECYAEGRKIEDTKLPYIQMDKGTDEEGNLKILLKDLIGLGDAIPLQTQRLELRRMSPSIWLKEHKQYVDLVVMEAILLQNDLETARTGSWEMPVVVMGNDDAWRKLIRPFSSIFKESSALIN